jgi:hypothetical protein
VESCTPVQGMHIFQMHSLKFCICLCPWLSFILNMFWQLLVYILSSRYHQNQFISFSDRTHMDRHVLLYMLYMPK